MPEQQRTLIRLPESVRGRRRNAPRIERTSDVTRTRGWLVGSLAGALGLCAALAFELSRGDALGPTRTISRPHRLAQLDCASCHGEARPGPATAKHDPAAACGTCHAEQRSTRPPHAALLASKQLRCTTCHRIHEAEGGIAFVPGRPAIHWRNGSERELTELDPIGAGGWTGRNAAGVALVELSACSTCHDPTRADDPMSHCALVDRHSPTDVAVCFDEHTPLLVAAGTERAALWELAREAAALEPPKDGGAAATSRGVLSLLWWLGLSLGAATTGLLGTRAWARRRDRKKDEIKKPSGGPDGEAAPDLAVQLRPAEHRRLPTIDATTCIGCSACVDACPYDVLEMRAYVAVVAKPQDCCGLTLCEQRCPNGSLIVTEGERIAELPRIDDALAARDAQGIHLAGDVTGLPLIRNAINQGAHAVRSIAMSLRSERARPPELLDLVIVGAGPAGIAAALEAEQQGLRYLVLEQASAAESIRSFPRGKLVFDQPLGMPMVGELWLRESSKEELLGKWLRIIHSHGLKIRERTRVLGCERAQGHLRVLAITEDGQQQAYPCARVLLACGRRGTPRKLDVPIPDAMLDHVHYGLADARSFAGRSVCVIGLGDVAIEAAIGLANQAGTRVVVSYRGTEFSRGKRRNVDELRRLVDAGRVDMLWGTEVVAIDVGRMQLRSATGAGARWIMVDSVFVMVGNVAPTGLLQAFGVQSG
jgi:thioredoxin reductase/NAD-dependent dihydropyrimidine dehydrogenase PreA subunit